MLGNLLVIVMTLLKVRCNVCCGGVKCNLFNDQTRCEGVWDCLWRNNVCRERTCVDVTSEDCSYAMFDSRQCKRSNNACLTVTSCTGWDANECLGKYERNSTGEFACAPTDGGCKVAVCGDFASQRDCNNTWNVGGKETGCYWDSSGSGSCKAATGCGSWGIDDCWNKYSNGNYCGLSDAGTCVVYSCSIYTTSDTCTSHSSCKWDTSCIPFTSCGEIDQTRCDRNTINGHYCFWTGGSCRAAVTCSGVNQIWCDGGSINETSCHWSGTSCRAFECGDLNDSLNCEYSYRDDTYSIWCAYNDSKCSPTPPPPECSTFTNENDCDNAKRGCYWLSSCPVDNNSVHNDSVGEGSAASLIDVPALFVALLLFLTL